MTKGENKGGGQGQARERGRRLCPFPFFSMENGGREGERGREGEGEKG